MPVWEWQRKYYNTLVRVCRGQRLLTSFSYRQIRNWGQGECSPCSISFDACVKSSIELLPLTELPQRSTLSLKRRVMAMVVTVSTHNGSVANREHNVRNRKVVSKEPHINPEGVNEIWIDEKPRKAYERIFGAALNDYNAKQVRADRRIDNYYSAVCRDKKKHPVYEMIVGVYGKKEDGSPICPAEQGKEIMQEFVSTWQERNPNLELIGAYYHADEQGEPHIHLDYIPVAHGYKRGLETQTGLVKALQEQGFEKNGKATAQIQWEARENDYLTQICEQRGLTVDHPKTQKQHLDTEIYKRQSEVKDLNGQIKALKARTATLTRNQVKSIDTTPKRLTGGFKGLSAEDAQRLVNTDVIHRRKIKEKDKIIEEQSKTIEKLESELSKARTPMMRDKILGASKSADKENQLRMLKQALNISENADYNECRKKLKQLGLLQDKNQNKFHQR